MRTVYLITGANGHLGSALVRELSRRGVTVRGLILPGSAAQALPHVTYYEGDVCKLDSLEPLFAGVEHDRVILIHTAGIVDISPQVTQRVWEVNVGGTRNILAACRAHGVARLVYVSSVHAIPEKDGQQVMDEVTAFSPELVEGGYAKTKAEATQLVLDAAEDGVDAVVVHPSGILGPYESSGNHLVQMLSDYLRGRLPACVQGGYDFVDVRDVALGCLAAAERGKTGSCYILSNRHYEIRELLSMVRAQYGGKRLVVLPLWMARLAEPFLKLDAKRKKERPLYTSYSLHTLASNDKFSHDRATRELGYYPRDLYVTIRDTVAWLREHRQEKKARRGQRKLHHRRSKPQVQGGN
jgi:dihydroflavonol-4-reductase